MKTQFKFTFYLDNKLAQSFELDEVELKKRFTKWLATKENDWLEYYSMQLANIFIYDTEGLSSTMDNKECYQKVYEILKKTKWTYLNSIGIK